MRLTYKYRMFPTRSQLTALEDSLNACHWVYNKTLETRKNAWEQSKKTISRYDTNKMLPAWKAEHPFLSHAFSQSLQEAQKRVDLAFRAFFRRVKAGEKPGYPRYKSRDRYDSYTYSQSGFRLLAENLLHLSKIGDVEIRMHRPLEGECKTLTIRRDSVGNWYACFSCIVEPKLLPPTDRVVGIDLGLTTFATLSDGQEIKRKRWIKQDARDIARLQRKKEGFAKGSPEWRETIRALQHAYRRQANRRSDFCHQESRKLVNKYQFIAFEDLEIANMQSGRNKIINQGIGDVAWDRFVQFTTYKAEGAGRGIALVNPRGTTQMCSGCGETVPKDLRVRKHDCPYCGLKLGRDHNAALNILARGLASLPDIGRGKTHTALADVE